MAKPEEKARKKIDEALAAAGWVVQDIDTATVQEARG
ncbi:MAG TPA: type I restriction endonuclease subunit R [Thermoanaerobaculia bacterium]|nr:type I restriction endonuclease subunit R [Thermoanaerobaculia bacterium]